MLLVCRREFVRGQYSLVCELSILITIEMPLELNGIRFESLPETWTSSAIYPSLTYEQCVELEEYYDQNYSNQVRGKRPKLPIDRFQWQRYFATPDHNVNVNIFSNVIKCWKNGKRIFAQTGLQQMNNHPGAERNYKRMLDYQNAMKAREAAAAAVNLLGASLSVSGSNPVRADSGSDIGSGNSGAGVPLADECTL